MVGYESDERFPFPRERLWTLLQDHLDDSRVSRIHPLIRQQRTTSRDGDSVIVDRSIDARGKLLSSQWKITYRPPDSSRWEIVSGPGPYAPGSWIENSYSEEGAVTRIRTRGEVTISVLPFFLPQRPVLRRVLDSIDSEDQRYLRG